MTVTTQMIGLALAAQRIMIPYQDAHRLLLIGKLRGEKRGGRWYVRLTDVERLIAERARETAAAGPVLVTTDADVIAAAGRTIAERLGALLSKSAGEEKWEDLLSLLLWYGFLGVIRDDGETSYIYSVEYDMKRLRALVKLQDVETTRFRVNPAFWRALEVRH